MCQLCTLPYIVLDVHHAHVFSGGGWDLRSRVAGVATTSVALPRVSAGAAVL